MLVPKPLMNIDLERTLRQRGMYRRYKVYLKNYAAAKERIKSELSKRNKEVETEAPISPYFSNDQLRQYAAKRIHIVNVREGRFKDTVVQYLSKLEQTVLGNIRTPKMMRRAASHTKDLFDDETEISVAIDLFTPLLQDVSQASATEALKIINANGIYVMKPNMHNIIQAEVAKFATSMLSTDRERLTKTIEDAFNNGASVAEVQNQVEDVFGSIKEYQSERIARTELLRASNLGQLDAYKQSEVVTGQQWLVDGDPCPECQALDGQIVSLDANWFDQGDTFMNLNFDYGDVDAPPLHPNCECTIVPVIEDANNGDVTLAQENMELKEYIRELETLAGVTDEIGI